MKVIITRGGSGAGKSTWAKNHHPNARIFSADNFFLVDGEYRFDPTKLGEAHGKCLRDYIDFCRGVSVGEYVGENLTAIVDNTNTTLSEFSPYAEVAQAYGHEVQILTFIYDPVAAHTRNTHSTPLKNAMGQFQRLTEHTKLIPPWWKHDYIVSK